MIPASRSCHCVLICRAFDVLPLPMQLLLLRVVTASELWLHVASVGCFQGASGFIVCTVRTAVLVGLSYRVWPIGAEGDRQQTADGRRHFGARLQRGQVLFSPLAATWALLSTLWVVTCRSYRHCCVRLRLPA